jgi:type IV pilus assembly protein PilV
MSLIPGRHAAGFTLLEVLVTVVVLSIGLLGVAGLSLRAQQSIDGSMMRSQAELLANSMLDAMRANATGVAAGSYATAVGQTVSSQSCTEQGSGCTAAQLAQSDLYNWKVRLGAIQTTPATPSQLPCGDGSVSTVSSGNLTLAIVTVQWSDARALGIAPSGSCSASGADIVSLSLEAAL